MGDKGSKSQTEKTLRCFCLSGLLGVVVVVGGGVVAVALVGALLLLSLSAVCCPLSAVCCQLSLSLSLSLLLWLCLRLVPDCVGVGGWVLAVWGSQLVGLLWQRREGPQPSLLHRAACHRRNACSCEDDRLLSGYRVPPVELICKPQQSWMQWPCRCFLMGDAC